MSRANISNIFENSLRLQNIKYFGSAAVNKLQIINAILPTEWIISLV